MKVMTDQEKMSLTGSLNQWKENQNYLMVIYLQATFLNL